MVQNYMILSLYELNLKYDLDKNKQQIVLN